MGTTNQLCGAAVLLTFCIDWGAVFFTLKSSAIPTISGVIPTQFLDASLYCCRKNLDLSLFRLTRRLLMALPLTFEFVVFEFYGTAAGCVCAQKELEQRMSDGRLRPTVLVVMKLWALGSVSYAIQNAICPIGQ